MEGGCKMERRRKKERGGMKDEKGGKRRLDVVELLKRSFRGR